MNSRPDKRQILPRLGQAWIALMGAAVLAQAAFATDRLFTYSYEPETMPAGAGEFEQWVTLRTQRNKAVGKENFNRWDLREEFEYGVTDRYTIALYVNTKAESYRDASAMDVSEFEFKGISLENKFLVLNPAEYRVGLALYLEPTFSGEEAEIEQKIILGQRHGNWKWALNLTHATEWEHNFHETIGELEASAGLAYTLNSHWAVGLEVRNHHEIPDYSRWENSAVYVGPVVSYRQERWWAALTIMPQVWGKNFAGNPDDNRSLDLDGHERVNVRLIFGIDF
jgi:hypothetical protein